MKKFFQDFKKFISRGNIVDMSVGVIIGTAFSAIVTALTNKIIMPFINLLLSIGGTNGLENAYTILRPVYTDGVLDLTKSIYIDWGAFITAIINFFLIALVLFIVLKIAMRADKFLRATMEDAANIPLQKKKRELRKLAKQQKRKFKVVWNEYLDEQAKLAEEKKKQEEANKPKVETTEDLLKDIRALLIAQQNSPKVAETLDKVPAQAKAEEPVKAE